MIALSRVAFPISGAPSSGKEWVKAVEWALEITREETEGRPLGAGGREGKRV